MIDEICYLISLAIDFLKRLGMSMAAQKDYEKAFSLISKRYEERLLLFYNQDLMDDMISQTESLYKAGEISSTEKYTRLRCVKMLGELHVNGEIHWHIYTKATKVEISDYFRKNIEDFLSTLSCCEDELKNVSYLVTDFCKFLCEHSVSNFSVIRQEVIRDYIAYVYPTHTQSMSYVLCRIRMFLKYIRETGVEINPMVFMLFRRPAKKNKTVKPIISQSDINKILGAVDKTKSPGKRNYAILVLAIYTGLRAVDIANLKLSDIYWKEKEIRITQHKTGKNLTLPLEDKVRDVIADYILNERPKSDSNFVFIKGKAPFSEFKRTSDITTMFARYVEKAGIKRIPNDGLTFHGLRRTLGTNMVSNGTPITTVSQVLGHVNPNTTKQYIYLDLNGLRKCTLSASSLGGEE